MTIVYEWDSALRNLPEIQSSLIILHSLSQRINIILLRDFGSRLSPSTLKKLIVEERERGADASSGRAQLIAPTHNSRCAC